LNKYNLRIVTLLLLTLCIGLYFYTDSQEEQFNTTAKPATKDILMAISDWQPESLLYHLSTEAKNTLSEQQLTILLNRYREFGKFQSFDELQFSRVASALSLFGSKRINYQTDATFSKSRARVNITLVLYNDQFKIYNLTISRL
jgi:hypothetical protein